MHAAGKLYIHTRNILYEFCVSKRLLLVVHKLASCIFY